MTVREIANLDSIIAEAREMQKDGHYINGTIFHAMADEIERLRACMTRWAIVADAARDHVLLWKHGKIAGLPRATRNETIEHTRSRLIQAVEDMDAHQ